jgi:serine/threonine protein phosphatase 1
MAGPSTFAIADLHGRFDLLEAALAAIEARAMIAAQAYTIVFLGDYVDRGPSSRQIVARLMAGPSDPLATWICLKGNHEDMMVQAARDPALMAWWTGNGGDRTLASYQEVGLAPADHLGFVESLPRLRLDRHRVYVHAGVDPATPLTAQSDKVLMWKRYPAGFCDGHGSFHVVHGHDPSETGPLLYPGRTALDTLAWRTGRLVVGVFDDDRAGGPVDLIEIRAKP